MKRHLTLALLAATLAALPAAAQSVMKVKMTSGATTEIPINKIANVTFGEATPPDTTANEARLVDLGLSVLWADRNVGATSEFDLGGRYGWGDPTGEKTSDNFDDYPSPIPPENISGTEYDIARAKWGGTWRLPTMDEFLELHENTKIASGIAYGSSGIAYYYLRVTAENGNVIYLPSQDLLSSSFPCITYWSGSLNDEKTENACTYSIYLKDVARLIGGEPRTSKLPVRPVMDKIGIETHPATGVTATTATLVGTVEDKGQDLEVGFLYGTTENLIEEGTPVACTPTRGEFTASLDGLTEGATYYYCAYVQMTPSLRLYGEVQSFVAQTTYQVGDLYPDAAAPEGVVFDVESGGRHGKIVSLDCAYNLAWDPDATLFTPSASCSNTTDGSQNNMPQKDSSAGQWYAEKGEGWYCPARGELLTLNRVIDKVNATLTSIGCDRQEGMYWSSTEDLSSGTGMNAFIVCIDHWLQYSGGWYDGVSKDNLHQVCAVKKF